MHRFNYQCTRFSLFILSSARFILSGNKNVYICAFMHLCKGFNHTPLLLTACYLSLFCLHLSPFQNVPMSRLLPHTSSLVKSISWINMRIKSGKMRSVADTMMCVWCQAVLRRKRRVSFTPHTPHTPPIIIIIITSAVTETIHCHDSSC